MDIPICVIDAQILVDHIQDIKRWIYNGQLRLVVPSSGMYPSVANKLASLKNTSNRKRRATLSKIYRDQADTTRTYPAKIVRQTTEKGISRLRHQPAPGERFSFEAENMEGIR